MCAVCHCEREVWARGRKIARCYAHPIAPVEFAPFGAPGDVIPEVMPMSPLIGVDSDQGLAELPLERRINV